MCRSGVVVASSLLELLSGAEPSGQEWSALLSNNGCFVISRFRGMVVPPKGAPLILMLLEKSAIKTTCPRDCYDACGITAFIENGRITRVRGDRDHHVSRGTLCRKCAVAYNGVFIDPTQRLATPLRRSGAKGSRSFEPVSWENALDGIATTLKTIIATRDPRTILQTHYTGTVSMLAGWFPNRFFNRLGATEVDPDTVCNKAGHLVLADMFGTSLSGFDPDQLSNASSLLIWGANPSHCAPHIHADWVNSYKARSSSLIR